MIRSRRITKSLAMETLHQANDIIADRYRIVNSLGRGQCSSTYEAEDLTNNQRVALKVLYLRQVTDWKVLELFEREAKILSNVSSEFGVRSWGDLQRNHEGLSFLWLPIYRGRE